ncbi:SWPV2-ORF036 [Shearwaterpox virus]|uniref:SWPV2-ORF036 n=1 Tax=Shearwaterpox virus TaxID=1974596 RepID=A0A1V0QG06_CNPV|nr:SWPV2-ORF036 [Shearwaterpox virus]
MVSDNIHLLVKSNDLKSVSILIENNNSVIEKKNKRNQSPVYVAIHNKLYEMTELLLLNNASLDLKIPPLIIATNNNDLQMIQLLIKHGAKINDAYLHDTPLMIALRSNYLDIAEYLLSLGAEFVKPRHKVIYSYLSKDAYELLFRFNCDVNIIDENFVTPMYYASKSYDLPLIELLLDNNVAVRNDLEKWYIMKKCMILLSVNRDILKRIYNTRVLERSNDILLYAVRSSNLLAVRFILEQGHYTDPIESVFNRSPLFYALKKRNFEIIEELIKYGAGKHMTTLDTKTLPLVISSYNTDMIEKIIKLIREEIDPEYGITLLLCAIRTNNIKIVKLILDLGVPVNIDHHNILPLQKAIQKRKPEIFELLIHYGADVRMKNIYGDTPLHTAASIRHFYSIKRLLELGADINSVNIIGETPLYSMCMININTAPIRNKPKLYEYKEETAMISHLMLSVQKDKDIMNDNGYKRTVSVIGISPVYNGILLNCQKELNYLKTQYLANNYTLCDFILDKDDNSLARFFKHPKLSKIKTLYFYKSIGEKNIRISSNRYMLLSKASDFISKCIIKNIPTDISLHICKLLTNEELKKIINY